MSAFMNLLAIQNAAEPMPIEPGPTNDDYERAERYATMYVHESMVALAANIHREYIRARIAHAWQRERLFDGLVEGFRTGDEEHAAVKAQMLFWAVEMVAAGYGTESVEVRYLYHTDGSRRMKRVVTL